MLTDLLSLFDKGGMVLVFIAILSLLMWTLILLCYWQLLFNHKDAPFDKEEMLYSTLQFIHTLVYTLPLLGLLGTVVGMINTFHALSIFGNSDARAMSAGISQALITTMAGLVTSISGLYFSEHISRLSGIKLYTSKSSLKTSLAHFSISPLLALRKIIRADKA